jgi:hypothetical protein
LEIQVPQALQVVLVQRDLQALAQQVPVDQLVFRVPAVFLEQQVVKVCLGLPVLEVLQVFKVPLE